MRIRSYSLLSPILLGLIIAACAGSTRSALPTQSQGCQFPIEWEIDYVLSGGFAGQSRSLSISSNRTMVVQDLQNGEKHESTISKDEVKKIAEMLTQACPFENSRKNNGCADCFVYRLHISMNGTQYSLETNETNVPENSVPLIEYLGSYLTNR